MAVRALGWGQRVCRVVGPYQFLVTHPKPLVLGPIRQTYEGRRDTSSFPVPHVEMKGDYLAPRAAGFREGLPAPLLSPLATPF